MCYYNILITGSRNWTDKEVVFDKITQTIEELNALHPDAKPKIIHGGCKTGADSIAQEFIELNNIAHEIYRAEWDRYGYSAGPIRNHKMVSLGAARCLAFPLGESVGTRGCIALARKAGIDVDKTEG